MSQELEITTISEKGQIVIPQIFRKEMGLKAKTKIVVVRKGDVIMMRALQMRDVRKEWEDIFKEMDKKKMRISDKEIVDEVKKYRRARRAK